MSDRRHPADIEGSALRYEAPIDLTNENNSHTLMILLTPRDAKVLEVGPATGHMTRVLRERGCLVTGVELDPEAARVAEPYCERMIVGDIERLDFEETFGEERFDVVIYGDVLEHLIDPGGVLRRTRGILAPSGKIVASIPNVAHGSVRLALLAGVFRYTSVGLLDETHLRFFTREGVEVLFADAGYAIGSWKQVTVDPFATEVPIREEDFPPYLTWAIRQDEEALAYQFVLDAAPTDVVSDPARAWSLPAVAPSVSRVRDHIDWLEREHAEKDRTIQRKDGEILHQKAEIGRRDTEIAERDQEIAERDQEIAEKAAAIAHKEGLLAHYELLTSSISFRAAQKLRRLIAKLAPAGSRRRSVVIVLGHGVDSLMARGFWRTFLGFMKVWVWVPRIFRRPHRLAPPLPQGPPGDLSFDDQYRLWLERNELTGERRTHIADAQSALSYRPVFSVVMPVFDPDPKLLEEAIGSVEQQIYPDWELCIADDGSRRRGVRRVLRRWGRRDSRILLTRLPSNRGIVSASNAALERATGDFVCFLDHDDELKPDALFEVARLLDQRRDLDLIYTDEDKREMNGRLTEPFFKPDWSPDLLMSVNYLNHLTVIRREVVQAVGGFRAGYDGSQDYDLLLRVVESTDKIAHIPRPLYSWRKSPGSAAASVEAKRYAFDAGERALEDAVRRRGYGGEVIEALVPGRYRVRYDIVGDPSVCIIIPTRDRVEMLERCVDSIRKLTTYERYEILIVDNESQEVATLEYLAAFEGRVLRYPHPFNYAKMMNIASREADADVLVFLNNDTEVISDEWLQAMLEHAQRPEVAAVGARLRYPDGRSQHEGIIVGFAGGSAGNVDFGGFNAMGDTIRNCSAVTGACMMVRRDVYLELGGLEERLGVAFNDVDFCLRAREKGYQIVYTPYAELYHHESATRGKLHPEEDEWFFRVRWGDPGDYLDAYYNPNFDRRAPFQIHIVT